MYNPINEGKTKEQQAALKSIWLEAGNKMDEIWLKLFNDFGVYENHEFITNIHSLDKQELMKKILDVDQICFNSSIVAGSESTDLIIKMMDTLNNLKVKGKIFISGGYLLHGLNNGYTIPNSERFVHFFDDNSIYELDAGFKRISHDGQKYVYTK